MTIRSRWATRAMFALLVVFALVASGCGASDDPVADSTAAQGDEASEARNVDGADSTDISESQPEPPLASDPSTAADPTPTVAPHRGEEQQSVSNPDPSSFVDQPIRSIDFHNDFSYELDFPGFPAAVVIDGGYTHGEFGDDDFYVFGVTEVDYGDLDDDGIEEAAVSTVVNYGGTGNFSALAVYGMRGDVVVKRGRMAFGDRAFGGLEHTEIDDGVLSAWSFSDGQGACCPDTVVESRLVLTDDLVAAEVLAPERWMRTDTEAPGPELKFLPGGDSAIITAFAEQAEAILTFDAARDQWVSVRHLDGPQPTVIGVRSSATGEDVGAATGSGVDSAGILLRENGLHQLVLEFEPDLAAVDATFRVSISSQQPSPEVPGAPGWRPQIREVVVDDPFDIRASAAWPELVGSGPFVATANGHIAVLADGELQAWVTQVTTEFEPQGDSSFELTYVVTYLSPDVVSVRFSYFDYICCRPYPNLGFRAITIDLTDGSVLEVDELLDVSRISELHDLWIDQLRLDDEFESDPRDFTGDDRLAFSSVALVRGGIEIGVDRGMFGAAVPPLTTRLTTTQLGDLLLYELPE